jgi:hypothetical protein
MSKKAEEYIEFAKFLASCSNGVSIHELEVRFGVSRSTVNRKLRLVRDQFGGLDERISAEGQKRFFIRKSVSCPVASTPKLRDYELIWSLKFGAIVLQSIGLTHHAQNMEATASAVVDQLKQSLHIDQRRALDDELNSRTKIEGLEFDTTHQLNSQIISEISIALHAKRTITIIFNDNQKINGRPICLKHKLGQASSVNILCSNNSETLLDISSIRKIHGLDDLFMASIGLAA